MANAIINCIGIVLILILLTSDLKLCFGRFKDCFYKIQVAVLVALLFDGLGWFLDVYSGKSLPAIVICEISYVIVIYAELIVAYYWAAAIQIFFNPETNLKFIRYLTSFTLVLLTILMIINGQISFLYDFENKSGYERGKFFWIFYLIYVPIFIYIYYVIIKAIITQKNNRRYALIFLAINLMICLSFAIQLIFYGVDVIFISFALIILFMSLHLFKCKMQDAEKSPDEIFAHTFGIFYLESNGKIIKFARKQSNELIAYLIDKKGAPVTVSELIYVLYERDVITKRERSKVHNLISDIKKTLETEKISYIFIKEYNSCRIDINKIKCDYYEALNGNKEAIKSFTGEYLKDYSWAEETSAYLQFNIEKMVEK